VLSEEEEEGSKFVSSQGPSCTYNIAAVDLKSLVFLLHRFRACCACCACSAYAGFVSFGCSATLLSDSEVVHFLVECLISVARGLLWCAEDGRDHYSSSHGAHFINELRCATCDRSLFTA